MQKELISKFLQTYGVKEDQINLLYSEELPEDFDAETFIETNRKDQTDLILAKNKAAIEKEYEERTKKERFLATANPVFNRVKRLGGLTDEELNGKSPGEAVDLLGARFESMIEEARKESGEKPNELLVATKNKLSELQNKYEDVTQQLTSTEQTFKSKLEEAEKRADLAIQDFKISENMIKLFNSDDIKWDDKRKVRFYYDAYAPQLKQMYHINEDLTILDKDGITKAIALDGNGFYSHLSQAVIDMAKRDNNYQMSNGGSSSSADNKKTLEVNGKTIDNSGVNALEGFLNS